MKLTKFRDIKQFPHCCYHVDIEWGYLEKFLQSSIDDFNLDLDPDFQRAHVWTTEQQIKYCEYVLQGGTSGKDIYLNCKGWMSGDEEGPYVIVDGKQRLQAIRMFMGNRITAFGSYMDEYTDRLRSVTASISWNIAAMKTRREVLNWYLDFNSGGIAHTEDELNKVRELLKP